MKLPTLAQKLGCRLEREPSIELTGAAGIARRKPAAAAALATAQPRLFNQ
jgi:hypothetical protein